MVLLNPIAPLSTSEIYARIVAGPVGAVSVRLNLTEGPTYDIYDNASPVGSYNGGVGDVPVTTTVDTLTVKVPNYNDGTTTILLKVVQAHVKKFGFIHKREIDGYTYLSPLASPNTPLDPMITFSAGSIFVEKPTVSGVQSTNEIIVKDNTTNKYHAIQFYQLPPVQRKQKLYYNGNVKFVDIIPSVDYEYTNVDTSAVPAAGQFNPLAVISSVAAPLPTIEFQYGEIDNGEMTLVKFDGKSVLEKLYKRKTINGTEIRKNVQDPALDLTNGFHGPGYSITKGASTGDPTSDEIIITVENKYLGVVNVPEFFITTGEHTGTTVTVTANLQLTLYIFETLPALSHENVYLLGLNTWQSDVPCRNQLTVGATTFQEDVTVTIPIAPSINEREQVLYIDVTNAKYDDYGLSLATDGSIIPNFKLIHIDKHFGRLNVVEGYTHPVSFDEYNEFDKTANASGDIVKINNILSFGTTPNTMKLIRTNVNLETASASIEASDSDLVVEARATGKTTIYFFANVTDVGGTAIPDRFVALEIITHPKPYADTVSLEFFEGASLNITPVNTLTSFYDPSGAPLSSITLVQGKNEVFYDYYGVTDATTRMQVNFNVKLFKPPSNFNTNHTMHVGETVELDLINSLFSETTGYTITDVTKGTPLPSIDVLTVGKTTNNKKVTLTAATSTVLETESYTVSVTISVPNSSLTLPPENAIVTLTVVVWNPAKIKHGLVLARPSATASEVALPTVMSSTEELLKVEYNGITIYDSSGNSATSHKALSWSKYKQGQFDVHSVSRTIDQYFMYTSANVYLIVVIVVEADLGLKDLFIDQADNPSTGHDIIDLFLPSLRDQLVELGYTFASNGTDHLNDYSVIPTSGTVVETLKTSTITDPTITTFRFSVRPVRAPSVIGNNLTFITPIKKVLKIKSTEVSYDSVLSTEYDEDVPIGTGTPASTVLQKNKGTNVADGIELFFAVPEDATTGTHMYSVTCKLTRHGVTETTVTIQVLAYDPVDTEEVSITTYIKNYVYTMGSGTILGYVFKGVNYGTRPSSFINITSTPNAPLNTIRLSMNKMDPRIAFTVQTDDGKFHIFDVSYLEPQSTDTEVYLFDGDVRTIGPEDMTTVEQGSTLVLMADQSQLDLVAGEYHALSESGEIVGNVVNNATTVQLTAGKVGVWANLQLMLKKGTNELIVFTPHVETLGSPIVQPQDIIVEKGGKVNLKLTDYILNNSVGSNGLSNYSFKNWTLAANGGAASTTLGEFTVEGNLLIANVLNTSGTFVLEANVVDRRRPTAVHPNKLTVTVVVLEDTVSAVTELLMINMQKQEIELTSPVSKISIGSSSIDIPASGEIILAGLTFKRGKVVTADPNYLTINALSQNLQPLSVLIFTKDGKRRILNITQVKSLKDVSMSAFEYVGTVFNRSGTGNTVVSYTFGTIAGLTGRYTTGLPVGEYVDISSDGTYNINLKQQVTIIITYKTSAAATNSTLTLEVNGQEHKTRTIERLPPPVVDLGGNPVKFRVQGTPLDESKIMVFSYGKFSYRGDKLYITEVTADFNTTLVQWEIESENKFIVESLLIVLTTSTNEQSRYQVIAGTSVEFMLSHVPYNVSYDTMVLAGADDTFDIFGRVSRSKIGRITMGGQSLQITADSNVADTTKPIGISKQENGKETKHYFTVEVIKPSTVSGSAGAYEQVSIGGIITPPTGYTFELIGAITGPTGPVFPTNTLDSKVTNLGHSLHIVNSPPTMVYRFYASLTSPNNNYTQLYEIGYVEHEIFVADITSIPLIAATTKTAGVVFSETGVTVSNGVIHNPNNHHVLTMTSPRYVKLVLNQL